MHVLTYAHMDRQAKNIVISAPSECWAITKMEARRTDAHDGVSWQWCLEPHGTNLVHNDEVMTLTKQPNLTAIIQSRRLSIHGHTAHMDDAADAKMILTARTTDNRKRPLGRPHITWLNTVQRDLRAYNLTLNEAVDLAQNRPLWRLMSTHGATHS